MLAQTPDFPNVCHEPAYETPAALENSLDCCEIDLRMSSNASCTQFRFWNHFDETYCELQGDPSVLEH